MILCFSVLCVLNSKDQVCDTKIGRPKKVAGNLSDPQKIAEILRNPEK